MRAGGVLEAPAPGFRRYTLMDLSAPDLRSPRRRQNFLAGAGIVVLVALLYGGAVGHGFTSWDDNHYVTQNPTVTSPTLASLGELVTTFQFCNYHPLTLLSFVGEHALVGLDPWLYHFNNVLLHALAAVLVYFLVRAWLQRDVAALVAALLFAVHPLRVESVAWVAERKGLLCAVFLLASLLSYTHHVERRGQRGEWRAYTLALALFGLGLLSKVLAIVLPGVLLVFLSWKRDLNRRRLFELVPFAGLSLLFAGLGLRAQAADNAIQGLHGANVTAHLLSVFKAIGFYAEKTLAPVVLSPRYELAPAASLWEPHVLAGLAVVVLVAVGSVVSWRRRGNACLGLGFSIVTWLPVSGLVASSTLAADRYTYLPAVGLSLVVGDWVGRARPRSWALGVVGVFIAFCALATPPRVAVWRDSSSLWADALRENPRNPFAHNQLSVAHLDGGRYGEAAAAAFDAARLGFARPGYLFNLCLAFRGLEDRQRELDIARTILEGDPSFVPAQMVVLRQLAEDGRDAECEQLLGRYLAARPGEPGLIAAQAHLEERRGRIEAALGLYVRSIELRPGDPEVLLAVAVLLARCGDPERALKAAASTAALHGALSPGARMRFRELATVIEESAGPQAGDFVRQLHRQAIARG